MTRLLEWKSRADNKPLILRGARQVGKSTLANELGKTYEVFINLNLEKRKDAALFTQSDNVQLLIEKIALSRNVSSKGGP